MNIKETTAGTLNNSQVNEALSSDISKDSKFDAFKVDVRNIIVDQQFNPRQENELKHYTFENVVENCEEDIKELAQSIKEVGLQEPLEVFKKRKSNLYVLTDGFRRMKAITYLIATGTAFKQVKVIKGSANIEDRIIKALVSGTMKKKLSPVSEAECYKRLMSYGYNQSEIAAKIGKTHTHVKDMLILAEQSKEVKNLVNDNKVKASTVVTLAKDKNNTQEDVTETVKEVVQEKQAAHEAKEQDKSEDQKTEMKAVSMRDVNKNKKKKEEKAQAESAKNEESTEQEADSSTEAKAESKEEQQEEKKVLKLSALQKLKAAHNVLCTEYGTTFFDDVLHCLLDKNSDVETVVKTMLKTLKEHNVEIIE